MNYELYNLTNLLLTSSYDINLFITIIFLKSVNKPCSFSKYCLSVMMGDHLEEGKIKNECYKENKQNVIVSDSVNWKNNQQKGNNLEKLIFKLDLKIELSFLY